MFEVLANVVAEIGSTQTKATDIPAAQDWMTAWGFYISLLGLVISILGFGFALHQISATKSAVDAGKVATDRALEALRSYSSASSLQSLTRAISDSIALLEKDSLVKCIAELRQARNFASELGGFGLDKNVVTETEWKLLKSAIDDIHRFLSSQAVGLKLGVGEKGNAMEKVHYIENELIRINAVLLKRGVANANS